nr:hypothetical protein [Tanacetum cinerariifolium]
EKTHIYPHHGLPKVESREALEERRHYLQTCPTSSTYRSSHFLPLALQGPTGLSALDSHLPPISFLFTRFLSSLSRVALLDCSQPLLLEK